MNKMSIPMWSADCVHISSHRYRLIQLNTFTFDYIWSLMQRVDIIQTWTFLHLKHWICTQVACWCCLIEPYGLFVYTLFLEFPSTWFFVGEKDNAER